MPAVNIVDADVLDKMEILEGAAWRQRQENLQEWYNPSEWRVSYYGALDELIKLGGETNPFGAVATIYGSGGFHRYYVQDDGTIRFSSSHARKTNTERAAALGFVV